ncbi:hypothetical protein A4X09_0g5949 [Tilletia walkeri]|uniref:Uncharacterized protein n=1 Tax=Tilletia walkeri TaxID=117179 RepID=A0A8X7N4T5_9BASI|nr:hypothetical protein A4X09_0g5949 [Tilletia walkeri]
MSRTQSKRNRLESRPGSFTGRGTHSTFVPKSGTAVISARNCAKLSTSAKRSAQSDVANVLAAISPARGAVESRARSAWLSANGVASTESDTVPILAECHASDSLATSRATLY